MRAGMMGDRASVIFAAPEEITKMIEPRCWADAGPHRG
jgi:cytochrome c